MLFRSINFLYSKEFLKILEKKFELEELLPDWQLFGGGLHQSFKGGFLTIKRISKCHPWGGSGEDLVP